MGGSEQTTPVHAIVIMLGRPPLSWQVTRAAGIGARKVDGLIERFFMGKLLYLGIQNPEARNQNNKI